MTLLAAVTQLKTLTFTGLVSSEDVPDATPSELPALIIDPVSQPFVEGFSAQNIALTKGTYTLFLDHLLLLSGNAKHAPDVRWDDIVTYTDRYLSALAADLTMNDELAEPLSLVIIQQGELIYRNVIYNGIRFRHHWKITIS